MIETDVTIGIISFVVAVFGLVMLVGVFDNKQKADELMTHVLAAAPVYGIAVVIAFVVVMIFKIWS